MISAPSRTSREAVPIEEAIRELLEHFATNSWFIREYWPSNQLRVRKMLSDPRAHAPLGSRVFEPGCGVGFVSFLASRIGYRVIGADAWEPEGRAEFFQRAGVEYFPVNLNALNPWPQLADKTFDAVLLGEVFEHILNHPLGLLREIHRVLRPGGLLLLTTPNPSTLPNAVRVLLDRHSLWGTGEFASRPKIIDGRLIDCGEIHYREYRACELRDFLKRSGFRVERSGCIACGASASDSLPKTRNQGYSG